MHVRAIAVLSALALAVPGAALAERNPAPMDGGCGDGPGAPAENLVAPRSLRPSLRAVFLAAHPALRSSQVVGPIRGRTYYGMKSAWYAVASFSIDGAAARPSVFFHTTGHPWRFAKDTHGGIAAGTDVPPELLQAWGFARWHDSEYWVAAR